MRVTRPHRCSPATTTLAACAQALAGAVVASRLVAASKPAAPILASANPVSATRATAAFAGGECQAGGADLPPITVVVPARDEVDRIEPLLRAVVGAPGVDEVVVVDDRSTDGTADLARRLGARLVDGAPRPPGWAGKAWALQQGIEAATGEWVVALDADTRPDSRLALAVVERAMSDDLDLLTVAARFDCPTVGARWLHPAMLTTLVYRFGPVGGNGSDPSLVSTRSGGRAGARSRQRGSRLMANGQCTVLPRRAFLADGGMAPVAGEPVEDVALARHRASLGRRVAFLDGSTLLTVRMYESFGETLRGWGRSIALPGVEPPGRQLTDATVLVLTTFVPMATLLGRRCRSRLASSIAGALVAIRLGTLVGTARVYERRGPGYWLSPLADPIAVGAVVVGSLRRRQTWRGRSYVVGRPTRPARNAAR